MRLLIISHTPHYRQGNRTVGWAATVEEINHLSTLFDEVVHLCPLHQSRAPAGSVAYSAPNVRLVHVRPAGGNTIGAKLEVAGIAPSYVAAIREVLRHTDVAHVRCPANVSLLAVVLLAMVRRPEMRWVKYAGNWRPAGSEPWSGAFQRWWLRHRLHRGVVSVNGRWPRQPAHVYSFDNPSLSREVLSLSRIQGSGRTLSEPIRLLFVGTLVESKGAGRALEIARLLLDEGLAVELHYLGDGRDRLTYQRKAGECGISASVHFHGWLPRQELFSFYHRGHFLLLPSVSEGWPKVLSEGMAFGVVPIASAVSSIPQVLSETGAGFSFAAGDVASFARAVVQCVENPDLWRAASQAGMCAAGRFTYDAYLESVRGMFRQAWSVAL